MVSALAALVALLGALIPTVFYVLFVWWLDRYDKEPVWLLALAFAWGAMPAAFSAHSDYARFPMNIIQGHVDNFTRTQTKAS